MSKKTWLVILFVFLFGIGIGLIAISINTNIGKAKTLLKPIHVTDSFQLPTATNLETAEVKRVIDGDTIELVDGRKLRYIGIDTPEIVDPNKPIGCFGSEAALKNTELVLGKEIYLEKDVSDKDKYGRLLRYVYLKDPQNQTQNLMVNQYLVAEGFAQVSTYPPDIKFQKLFLEAQTEARSSQKGLWNKCVSHESSIINKTNNAGSSGTLN